MRRHQALRALTVVVFLAVAVVGFVQIRKIVDPPPTTTTPELRGGETDVAQAINIAQRDPLVVRGVVFDGPGGLGFRLCQGVRRGSPPRCLGPFLDLDGIDTRFFNFERGDIEGSVVRWVREPVALRGTIVGTRMFVTEVLQ